MTVSVSAPDSSLLAGGGSARCLVVDDDPLVRRTLVRILRGQGLAALEAGSGAEALDILAAQGPIPFVLSDVYMPGLTGLDLLREIRRRYPDTAVVMITGVAEVGSAVESLQLGALDYLVKPIQVEEVRARIHRALERHQSELDSRHHQESYQERIVSQVRELSRRNREMFLGQVQMAVRMLEKKDVFTRGHSDRVAEYAVRMAIQLGYTGPILDQIRMGGTLHDIGKIGTRDLILNKPGPLTPQEFAEIRSHVLEGEEILEPLRRDHPVLLAIIRHHHERVDGSGFPDGLAGDDIPLAARIVAVADAFDAMTTSRAYRPTREPADALEELDRWADRQFDRNVILAFRRAFPDVSRLPISLN
jgi:putative two-component system response regulator